MKKKTIVEKDKAKIAELITELDQKKKEALETAWKKVNKASELRISLVEWYRKKLIPRQCFHCWIGFWQYLFNVAARNNGQASPARGPGRTYRARG